MTLEAMISECETLAQIYYRLISGDHHKDRDCHFYVTTRISGYPASERAGGRYTRITTDHTGYLTSWDVECDTLDEAFTALADQLYQAIGRTMRENRDGPYGDAPTEEEAYARLMNAIFDAAKGDT